MDTFQKEDYLRSRIVEVGLVKGNIGDLGAKLAILRDELANLRPRFPFEEHSFEEEYLSGGEWKKRECVEVIQYRQFGVGSIEARAYDIGEAINKTKDDIVDAVMAQLNKDEECDMKRGWKALMKAGGLDT